MTWLVFLIFLGVLGYMRYLSPMPETLDQPYIMSALLVLSATAIVPFFVSYLMTRATQLSGRAPAIMLGFLFAMTLSLAGAWAVWKYFGGAMDMRVPLQEALKLALVPGIGMGVILAMDTLMRRRA